MRTDGAAELIRLQSAAPYVAWRDADGALQVHELSPRSPATIGRVSGVVTFPDERLVSRVHAEVTMRVYSDPDAVGVYLLDSGSRHGTEHRTATLRHGRTVDTGRWRNAPHAPAPAAQLDAGDHDVRLAGELYVLIGGVPLDEGSTNDRADIPEPTAAPARRPGRALPALLRVARRARGAGEQRRDRVQVDPADHSGARERPDQRDVRAL